MRGLTIGRLRAAAASAGSDSAPSSAQPPSEADEAPRRRGARLRQQTLPAHVVTFSPRSVLSFYLAVGLVLAPLGAAVLAASARAGVTAPVSYATAPGCDVGAQFTRTRACVVPFEVERRIRAPAFLYYSLTDFFQNTRKYASSRSAQQLRGLRPKDFLFVSNCAPLLYKENSTRGRNGFVPEEFLNPCGLTAWSQFNDSFSLCRDAKCDGVVPLRKDGIAWGADRQKKFQPGPKPLFSDEANARLQDEDFMVWMRLSTFKDFHKLYRIIDTDLEPGTYYMNIRSNFPVAPYNGDKLFFIQNMAWFGESNYFLGILLLVVGILCVAIAVLLLVRDVLKPRPPIAQDPDRLLIALARLNAEFAESNPSASR